jgi:hypothetical protein
MQLKKGVVKDGVCDQLWAALEYADQLKQRICGKELVVTSLLDGKHKKGSKHYSGEGADLRTRDMTPTQLMTWFHALKAALDKQGFDVVLESDHIHLEYDPKPGDTFALSVPVSPSSEAHAG